VWRRHHEASVLTNAGSRTCEYERDADAVAPEGDEGGCGECGQHAVDAAVGDEGGAGSRGEPCQLAGHNVPKHVI
jgi:hypothetical protein